MNDELWSRYLALTGKQGWRKERLGNTKLHGRNNFSRLYYWLRDFECYDKEDASDLQGMIWASCKRKNLKQDLTNWKNKLEEIRKEYYPRFGKQEKRILHVLVKACDEGAELVDCGNKKDLMEKINEENTDKMHIISVMRNKLEFFYSRIKRINEKTILAYE